MKMTRLTGLVAAAYTPMHDDGSIKLEAVPGMVDYLVSAGMSGIYVCGSTGEGPSLRCDERKAVAEAFVQACGGRLPIVIQVGHNSVAMSKALAAHAQAIGADMISSNSPSYFKPGDAESLVLTMAEVASGAPELPFYYYHIPSFTGVPIDMVEFLERSPDRIPSLVGIKFSDLKVFDYQACLNCCDGKYDILWGCDEMMLSALAVGARGAIGSTFNAIAPVYLRILEAFDAGDLEEARRFQYLSVQFVKIMNRHAPLHTSLKAVMKMVGIDCGGVRLPQQPLPGGVSEKIRADLETAGLVRWLGKA